MNIQKDFFMHTYLFLICNASKALVYSTHEKYPQKPLSFVIEFEHPDSRKKRMDLVTDRPGHFQTSHTARSAYENHIDPKEREADHFAKEISLYLEEKLKKKAFDYLILVASIQFFSLLKKHLSTHVANTIIRSIHKDHVHQSEPELRSILNQRE